MEAASRHAAHRLLLDFGVGGFHCRQWMKLGFGGCWLRNVSSEWTSGPTAAAPCGKRRGLRMMTPAWSRPSLSCAWLSATSAKACVGSRCRLGARSRLSDVGGEPDQDIGAAAIVSDRAPVTVNVGDFRRIEVGVTRPRRTHRLVTIAEQDDPPLRSVAGADAVTAGEQKANDLLAQVDAYRELSTNLAHDDVPTVACASTDTPQ